jgi:HD-GYP domain-containing protein (c-di-GMP phosphodiesterase class II)
LEYKKIKLEILDYFLELPFTLYASKNKYIQEYAKKILPIPYLIIDEFEQYYCTKKSYAESIDELKSRSNFSIFKSLPMPFDEDGFHILLDDKYTDEVYLKNTKDDYGLFLAFAEKNNLSPQIERIRYYSHFQFLHSITLSYFVNFLSRKFNWNESLTSIFNCACYLHDISMPDILIEEYEIDKNFMKIENNIIEKAILHCEDSVKLLQEINIPDILLDIILLHHEDINGEGYPQGLKLERLSTEVQLFCLLHRWLVNAFNLEKNNLLSPESFLNSWDKRWDKLKAAPYLNVLKEYFEKINN